jgi:hypothetical protein
LFIGAVNLVGRQLFPPVSEYFHKASVVFFYRGFVTIMFSRQKANTTLSKIKHLPSAKDGNPNYNN